MTCFGVAVAATADALDFAEAEADTAGTEAEADAEGETAVPANAVPIAKVEAITTASNLFMASPFGDVVRFVD